MTKEQQIQIVKDAFVRNLRKEDNIPENLGEIYTSWVRGKINQASQQLLQEQQNSQPQEEEAS